MPDDEVSDAISKSHVFKHHIPQPASDKIKI